MQLLLQRPGGIQYQRGASSSRLGRKKRPQTRAYRGRPVVERRISRVHQLRRAERFPHQVPDARLYQLELFGCGPLRRETNPAGSQLRRARGFPERRKYRPIRQVGKNNLWSSNRELPDRLLRGCGRIYTRGQLEEIGLIHNLFDRLRGQSISSEEGKSEHGCTWAISSPGGCTNGVKITPSHSSADWRVCLNFGSGPGDGRPPSLSASAPPPGKPDSGSRGELNGGAGPPASCELG